MCGVSCDLAVCLLVTRSCCSMIDMLEAGNVRVDPIAAQVMDEDGIHPFLEADGR